MTFFQGRPFAWQEMQLVLASVLQKFDLSLVDPSYNLELKQSLTIKPKDLRIYASPRIAKPRHHYNPNALSRARGFSNVTPKLSSVKAPTDQTQPLYVLYGSNTGTSEAFAQRIAYDALSYGPYSFPRRLPAI
jgi:cytochrome P450/NADPH-cytochrome P450 reductase